MLLVQKPYGLGENTVCKSSSPCLDALATSTRRQLCENSIASVVVVLYDVLCFSKTSRVVDALHGDGSR